MLKLNHLAAENDVIKKIISRYCRYKSTRVYLLNFGFFSLERRIYSIFTFAANNKNMYRKEYKKFLGNENKSNPGK